MYTKTVALAKISCLGFALVSGLAFAASKPAFDGIAATPSENACWSHSMGSVTNNCSGQRTWCMPLPVSAGGYYTVDVAAYGPDSSSNVSCWATGVDRSLWPSFSSDERSLQAFGSAQIISLYGAYVLSGGTLYACCRAMTYGRINAVNWLQ